MSQIIEEIKLPNVFSPAVRCYRMDDLYALFHTMLLNVVYLDGDAVEKLLNSSDLASDIPELAYSRLYKAGYINRRNKSEEEYSLDFLQRHKVEREKNINLRPSFIRLVMTERCNLKCDYCFVSHSSDGTTISEVSISDILKSMNSVFELNAGENLCIQYFGGEPTLRLDDIIILSAEFKSLAKYFEVDLLETMVTNGIALNREKVKRLIENDINFSVSLDGCDVASSKQRYGNSAELRIEKLKDLFHNMAELGLSPSVNLTPSTFNIDKLPDIITEMAQVWGVKSIFVNTPIGWNYSIDGVSPEYLSEQLIKANYRARREGVRLISIFDRFIRGLDEHRPQIEDCHDTGEEVSIALAGTDTWSLCDMNWHVDDFLCSGMPDMKSEACKKVKFKDLFPFKECLTCEAKMVCGGPCANEVQLAEGGADSYRCEFFRSTLKRAVFFKGYN